MPLLLTIASPQNYIVQLAEHPSPLIKFPSPHTKDPLVELVPLVPL